MSLRSSLLLGLLLAAPLCAFAAEYRLRSPDGHIALVISDDAGLRYRVEVDRRTVVADSVLGLEFADGLVLGPTARITATKTSRRDDAWENAFGKRRRVVDRWRELRLDLQSADGLPAHQFGLVARAYDDGVAFRYDLPAGFGPEEFTLARELTEFRFPADHRCWAGGESTCAETTYPETRLSAIPALTGDKKRSGQPYRSVLPLLVETPAAYVAVAEADLLDWAGLFLAGTGEAAVRASLAPRTDGRGAVVGRAPMLSPWRVLMIGRTAAGLVDSDLIANLATPSRVADASSWVRPGVCAWDAWWTGENPSLPQHTGLDARGDTRSHLEYIDFAAEMGWPYQLVDWFWYKDDPTRPLPHVDLPALLSHAKERGVRLFIWMHSKDLTRVGFETVFSQVEAWGAAGVKVDFMDSDSQETVRWYVAALEAAARHHLMVDFHGAYKPTGLARTYPNFITQEGVLGNEYNKLGGNRCDPLHTATLPFTRGLLGPMDFTPGGFLNRTPVTFRITHPAQVMGTRARQLAMTVVYTSPLLVLCDSPANYRGQPGVEFFRGLPTVWDETTVLAAEVGRHIVVARRSGERWWLAAMNGADAATLEIPLDFLGRRRGRGWSVREFADGTDAGTPETVVETTHPLGDARSITLRLQAGGGYAAVLERVAAR